MHQTERMSQANASPGVASIAAANGTWPGSGCPWPQNRVLRRKSWRGLLVIQEIDLTALHLKHEGPKLHAQATAAVVVEDPNIS